jgi:hypothetical protein
MTCVPALPDAGVYVTLQVPEDRAHVVLLKEPAALVVNVTVPVGVIAPVPEESATVAVHVVACRTVTDAGEQETVVLGVLIVDVTVNVPLLLV